MEIGIKSVRSRLYLPKRSPVIAVPVLLLLLAVVFAGCDGSTGATQGASTSATEGGVAPTPGATLSGPVDISGKASSAIISLVVSDDGASITSVGATLNDLKTESFSAGSMDKRATTRIPITGGSFSGPVGGLGTIEGKFTSPTEASGTVKLNVEIPFSEPADLGEFSWTASAQ